MNGTMMNRTRHRRGAIVVAMVIVLVLLGLLVVGMVMGGARDQDLTVRRVEALQAVYACEAGVNMALRERMLNVDEDGDGQVGSISDDGNAANDPALGSARFAVTLLASGGQTTLTSASRSGQAHRVATVTLQDGGTSGASNAPGIALSGGTGIWGSNVIDSYDSSLGPYGGANVGSEAMLACNIVSSNGMAMGNDVTIKGKAYCGVGGNPNNVIAPWASPTITGGKHALTDALVLPTVSPPTGMPASSGSLNLWGTNSVTIFADTVYKNINMSNDSKIFIDGNVRLRVTGSFNFSNNSAIELVGSTSTLELYLDNAFTLNNDTCINANTADPTRVTVVFLGNNKALSLNTTAQLHAKVVNPNGEVNLWGDSEIFGSVVAKALAMSNNSSIHIDTQLVGGGGGGGSTQVIAVAEVEP